MKTRNTPVKPQRSALLRVIGDGLPPPSELSGPATKRAWAALRLLAIRRATADGAGSEVATDEDLFHALHVGLQSAPVSSEGAAALAALHDLIARDLGASRQEVLVAEWEGRGRGKV